MKQDTDNNHIQEKAVDILINNIIQNKVLDLKKIPDWVLDLLNFTSNGPSQALTTVSIYYYLNFHGKRKSDVRGIEVPFKKMLKLTREMGFLCQVERMRRKRVLDYSIDMSRIFDPATKISISKGPNFLKHNKETPIS